jgi:predicted helicase
VIRYAEVDWKATREEKFALLERCEDVSKVEWRTIDPDQNFTWLREGLANDFNSLMPLGAKGGNSDERIFRSHSLGVSTNRDAVVYGFDSEVVSSRVEGFCETFTAEVQRYQQKGAPKDVDGFVEYEKLKWSRNLKRHLRQMKTFKFDASHLRTCLYRPFTALHLYAAPIAVDELGQMLSFFPSQESEDENRVICVSDVGLRSPFSAIATNRITDLHLCASTDAFQCFPFYTYDGEDGARRENIPLSTLVRFQNHYGDEAITKWDIFHYVYAVLHHPEYRTRYAANLRRELPRIPLVGVQASACGKTEEKKAGHSLKAGLQLFRTYAANGQKLADLHVHYEQAAEHPLQRIENPDEPLNWRVEKMRLTRDKTALVYNDFLTLAGIPEAAFAYRLGNRSALEWVIDQYQTSTDPRSGITNDPNREDEPDYIVKLIGKVITVSLETQQLVGGLPPLDLT